MTLTIEVTPDVEARLLELAAQQGMAVEAVAADVVAGFLTDWEAELEADTLAIQHRLDHPDPRPHKTLADLRAHLDNLKDQQREAEPIEAAA